MVVAAQSPAHEVEISRVIAASRTVYDPERLLCGFSRLLFLDDTLPGHLFEHKIPPRERAIRAAPRIVIRWPARQTDEWYHADLIGLAALSQDGGTVGTVVAVQNFGAGDLLEVKPAQGGATVLVPFTRDTVPEVDVEGGRLTLNPPEGLFE